MRRRINSTGRKKIPRELAEILPGQEGRFDVRLDLGPLGLPAECRVIVEAHVQSVTERFSFGTVANMEAEEPTILRRLPIEDTQFRVKVVDPAAGRLLARVDRLRADDREGSSRRELLLVRVRDLGPEPWRTELLPTGEPCLVLNEYIPGAASRITTDPVFQALVLPAAFRQVLHLLWAGQEQIEPEEDTPASRWLSFAEALTDDDLPDWSDRDLVLDWVNKACAAFASRHEFIKPFTEADHGDGKTAH